MGSWSSSAPTLPSGSSWSSEVDTGNCADQFYKAYAKVSVARGTTNTIYVRMRVYCWLKLQGYGARTFPVKCQVNNDSTTTTIECGGDYFGYWAHIGDRYYTTTAAPGDTIRARLLQSSDSTDAILSAPAYVTKYTISYNGNGADGGSTSSQSKTYKSSVNIKSNGFTRERYNFINWNTKADGSGTTYLPGATYSTDANLSLYAQWEKATIPVYVTPNGVNVYEADMAYINIGGQIKEADIYINIGGQIYLIS